MIAGFHPVRARLPVFWCLLAAALAPMTLYAETGKMIVQVLDTDGRPVAGLEIGIQGIGGSQVTDSKGTAQLSLGRDTVAGDYATLQVFHSPPGTDFVLLSPWDGRVQVPSFKEKAENFVKVIVIQRGNLALLRRPNVTRKVVEELNAANGPRSANQRPQSADTRATLNAIAKRY